MPKIFLKWWLALLIQLSICAVSGYYGFFDFVYEKDATYLSFLIIAVWFITSCVIGYKTISYKKDFEVQWFSAESCMTLGMIGTVIGFLMMLGNSFEHLDVANIQAMRDTISEMAVGLSVALVTTLVGLISSLFLKVQMIIIENSER